MKCDYTIYIFTVLTLLNSTLAGDPCKRRPKDNFFCKITPESTVTGYHFDGNKCIEYQHRSCYGRIVFETLNACVSKCGGDSTTGNPVKSDDPKKKYNSKGGEKDEKSKAENESKQSGDLINDKESKRDNQKLIDPKFKEEIGHKIKEVGGTLKETGTKVKHFIGCLLGAKDCKDGKEHSDKDSGDKSKGKSDKSKDDKSNKPDDKNGKSEKSKESKSDKSKDKDNTKKPPTEIPNKSDTSNKENYTEKPTEIKNPPTKEDNKNGDNKPKPVDETKPTEPSKEDGKESDEDLDLDNIADMSPDPNSKNKSGKYNAKYRSKYPQPKYPQPKYPAKPQPKTDK